MAVYNTVRLGKQSRSDKKELRLDDAVWGTLRVHLNGFWQSFHDGAALMVAPGGVLRLRAETKPEKIPPLTFFVDVEQDLELYSEDVARGMEKREAWATYFNEAPFDEFQVDQWVQMVARATVKRRESYRQLGRRPAGQWLRFVHDMEVDVSYDFWENLPVAAAEHGGGPRPAPDRLPSPPATPARNEGGPQRGFVHIDDDDDDDVILLDGRPGDFPDEE